MHSGALMDLEFVWIVNETQLETTVKNVLMATWVMSPGERPLFANRVLALCRCLPTLQSPVTEKMEWYAVGAKKIMQGQIAKDIIAFFLVVYDTSFNSSRDPSVPGCAPGYYGNPLLIGSSCKKCDCSGNSDPNLIFEDCDEVTGQCRNCMRNTTGFNCELCAPGYYGDARIARGCTVCNCGGGPCDRRTGECLAEPPMPPPGTDCPVISCDKCIWDLTDDISLAAQSIDESKATLLSISTGVAAHRHLHDLNSTAFILKVKLSEKDNNSVLMKSQLDHAANEMTDLLKEINTLDEKRNQESRKDLLLQKEATEITDRATILVQALGNMIENIQVIDPQVVIDMALATSVTALAQAEASQLFGKLGDQIVKCDHCESEVEFSLDDDQIRAFHTALIDDGSDPIGLKIVSNDCISLKLEASQILKDQFASGKMIIDQMVLPVNKQGHPIDTKITYYAINPGIGLHYDLKFPAQTLAVLNTRGSGDNEFLKHITDKHYMESFHRMGVLDNAAGHWVRFSLKGIFNLKFEFDVTKVGQGISGWSIDVSAIFCSVFRVLTKLVSKTEREWVLTDAYTKDEFMSSEERLMKMVPSVATNAITDADMFHANQNEFTQALEREY
ncbi:hypothetical protein JD844_024351 [Phrynosoma platyrhinos]|uniref:Laminin EGF-like domain-containing protein n=1 Tax=Phrynosoma platyrhinos TaxID=52577 RepID=A0ABQ7SY57_PHRPL|nr:hypothetical protein JD844_024351 [Phrynosoma platyrhinos]